MAGRRDGGTAAVLNGPGTLSASIGFWSALLGLVCALQMLFAPDAALDTMAFAPFVALGAAAFGWGWAQFMDELV